jgi:hypothetical protein
MLEIVYGYLAHIIIVEQLEHAPNLLHQVTRENLLSHCHMHLMTSAFFSQHAQKEEKKREGWDGM